MSNPHGMAELVTDQESLCRFIREFRQHIEANATCAGVMPSENYSLGAFLEAAEAWSATDIALELVDGSNPWKAAANVLLMGHYYE